MRQRLQAYKRGGRVTCLVSAAVDVARVGCHRHAAGFYSSEMLHNKLVIALVSWVVIGAVTGLPTPQHRFAHPVQFSFKTVHTPSLFGSQIPNGFFGRNPEGIFATPTRLTIQPDAVQKPSAAPVELVESVVTGPEQIQHVPVMIPVPQDFVGDSVVVSPEDLTNMGLTGTTVREAAAVTVATENIQPAEFPVQPTVDTVEPVDQVIVATVPEEGASVAGPLSFVDDSFVLTALEAEAPQEAAPVELSPKDNTLEPEVSVPSTVEQQEIVGNDLAPAPAVTEAAPAPASPFETETYHAYNNFINTWLQLASVNLNRPDLLNLINNPQLAHLPAPALQEQPASAVTEPEAAEEASEVNLELTTEEELLLPVEVVEVTTESQVIAESSTIGAEEVTPTIADMTVDSAVDEVQQPAVVEELQQPAVVEEVQQPAVVEEVQQPAVVEEVQQPAVVEEVQQPAVVEEVQQPAVVEEVQQPAVVEEVQQPAVVEEVQQPAVVEEVQQPAVVDMVQQAAVVVDAAPQLSLNTIPEVVPQSGGIPSHFNTIPRLTSRGRLSGFRYSFSHVPQRGTHFFNSIAG